MLHIEQDGENRMGVSASGAFEERQFELASLICVMANEAERVTNMKFDDYCMATCLLAKVMQKHATTLDASKFKDFLGQLGQEL